MRLNLKLRLQNKTTLFALCTAIIAFVYQILGIIGIVPTISEDTWVNVVDLVLNILWGLGIIVDPTTNGLSDSALAMTYDEPRVDDFE